MNETIGAKAGKNDTRRRLIITKKQQKILQAHREKIQKKEFEELEKKIKNQQIITFIKTLPITAIGQVYETLTENNEKKKELALKEAIYLLERENIFSEKDLLIIITALKEGNIFSLDEELLSKLGLSIEGYKRVGEIDLTDFSNKETNSEEITASSDPKSAVLKVVELSLEEKASHLLSNDEQQKHQQLESFTQKDKQIVGITSLDTIDEKLDKLKNHKIIDEYETKLKDIRLDLRQLIFEYNLVSESSNNLYGSKEAEELLNKLNEIIKKIEQLKEKINFPDINKYEDNYLYTLVADYIEEFKNKKFVDEIKDSELYIMISEKLTELDTKKDILQDKIETRKKTLELDEMRLEQVRTSYFNYEKFNNELLKFQASQDDILNEIRNKMSKATTIQERVEVQVVGMRHQSRRLLALLGASMLIPGARSARGIATMTATYLYFMRNLMNPQTVTKKYKTIKVEDYSKDIENSLEELENISLFISKTSKQLNKTINDFEKEFSEYINVIPECKQLLDNLEKIKDELAEKEYEIKRITEEQEKNLEKNNEKVKLMEYDVAV